MTRKKTGDPKDRGQHAGGARFVPITGAYGTAVVIPGPMTPGKPQPEPEERWTLAPGRRPEPPAREDDGALECAPVEPVPAEVARSDAEGGEPARS